MLLSPKFECIIIYVKIIDLTNNMILNEYGLYSCIKSDEQIYLNLTQLSAGFAFKNILFSIVYLQYCLMWKNPTIYLKENRHVYVYFFKIKVKINIRNVIKEYLSITAWKSRLIHKIREEFGICSIRVVLCKLLCTDPRVRAYFK